MRAMPDEGRDFATPLAWSTWLSENQDAREVWVIYWKKGSGKPSINWQEAVVEALCWGWIDGVRKSVDEARFKQRFTPRRAGSAWSAINCAHAERLILEGRMQEPGLAAINVAKANGRWAAAYAGGMGKAEIPADFLAALQAGPEAARKAWEELDSKNRYAIYYRVTTAKKPETRARKVTEYVDLLARGEKLM